MYEKRESLKETFQDRKSIYDLKSQQPQNFQFYLFVESLRKKLLRWIDNLPLDSTGSFIVQDVMIIQ